MHRYNPWTQKDVVRHNKAASRSKRLRDLWVRVANDTLERYGDEGRAIRTANYVVKRVKNPSNYMTQLEDRKTYICGVCLDETFVVWPLPRKADYKLACQDCYKKFYEGIAEELAQEMDDEGFARFLEDDENSDDEGLGEEDMALLEKITDWVNTEYGYDEDEYDDEEEYDDEDEDISIRHNPSISYPEMTDLEFFWGAPNEIEDDNCWFRAFRALPGKPYQNYFHLYTWKKITSKKDLHDIVSTCVRSSIYSRPHGKHGKIILQCCPKEKWNAEAGSCIDNRPLGGARSLFYKVLIPDNDLPRLMRLGLARIARQHVTGLPVSKVYGKSLIRNPSYWGRSAAGIMFFCEDEALLTLRSSSVLEPGTWGIPGGSIRGEWMFSSQSGDQSTIPENKIWEGAVRETIEELGSIPNKIKYFDKVVFQDGSFTYTTFLVKITEKQKQSWEIQLNWENDEAKWTNNVLSMPDLHNGIKFIVGRRPSLFGIKYLYHATYKPLLESIKLHGLGGKVESKAWEFSHDNTICLTNDKMLAVSYAEISDAVPGKWLSQIRVIRIPVETLNTELMHVDRNEASNLSWEYRGVIPWSNNLTIELA